MTVKVPLSVIGLLTAVGFCMAADGPFGPRPTLEQLSAMLTTHSANSEDHKARVKTIRAIDAFFDSTDRATQADVIQFYHENFSRLISWLGRNPVGRLKRGPLLFWGEHVDLPTPRSESEPAKGTKQASP